MTYFPMNFRVAAGVRNADGNADIDRRKLRRLPVFICVYANGLYFSGIAPGCSTVTAVSGTSTLQRIV